MNKSLITMLGAIALTLPMLAQSQTAKDTLVIGMSQYPPSLHPGIDPTVAKTYGIRFAYRPIATYNDDRQMLEGLGKLLDQEGYRVTLAPDGATGLRLLREAPVDLVLTDLKMPGLDGVAVLREIREAGLEAEVVLLTGHGSIDAAVQAMKAGAFDFLTKPPDTERGVVAQSLIGKKLPPPTFQLLHEFRVVEKHFFNPSRAR